MTWTRVFRPPVRRAGLQRLTENSRVYSLPRLGLPCLCFEIQAGDEKLPPRGLVSGRVGVPCFVPLGFASLLGTPRVGFQHNVEGVWQ